MTSMFRRQQRGNGLLSLALGLAVAGIMAAGIVLAYNQWTYNQKLQETAERIKMVDGILRTTYSGRLNYPDLGSMADETRFNNLFPASMKMNVSGNERLAHPLGGLLSLEDWDVGCSGCRNAVRIGIYGLKGKECVWFLTQDYGPNAILLSGSLAPRETNMRKPPLTSSQATSLCNSGRNESAGIWFKK